MTNAIKKVLVLITPQFNAKNLIDEGKKKADLLSAQLHILYIKKGNNIFSGEKTALLLQDIYSYGSSLGGVVHAGCGENIKEKMAEFIIENNITDIVMGQSPLTMKLTGKDISKELSQTLQQKDFCADIHVIEREDQNIYAAI